MRATSERFSAGRSGPAASASERGNPLWERVGGGIAADVRVLDLEPSTDDGFDLSDFVREARTAKEREAARRILLRCAEKAPRIETTVALDHDNANSHEGGGALRFERLDVFAAAEEVTGESLIGVDEHETLLPADGTALIFGAEAATLGRGREACYPPH